MNLDRILARLKPSKQERKIKENISAHVIEILSKQFDDVRLLGSFARNTELRGNSDLDIFVFFDKEEKNIGDKVVDFCKKHFKHYEINYAQHKYIRLKFDNIYVDVVPGYRINKGERILSAVDRTPFHHEFLTKYLKEDLKDEVRLLKGFLKGINVYGAEIKTMGFSGYLTELLIVKYQSFENVLKSIKDWQFPVSISLTKCNKVFNSLFTFIDPVDCNRNVASPISNVNIIRLFYAARSFIQSPSKEYFFPTKIRKPQHNLFTISFDTPNITDDTRYGELNKIRNKLIRFLSNKHISILDSYIHISNKSSYILLETLESNLNPNILVRGPIFYDIKNIVKFLPKPMFVTDGNYMFKIKKSPKHVKEYIMYFLKHCSTKHYREGKLLRTTPKTVFNLFSRQKYIDSLIMRFLSHSS